MLDVAWRMQKKLIPDMQMEWALTFEPRQPKVTCTQRELDEAMRFALLLGVGATLEPTRKPH